MRIKKIKRQLYIIVRLPLLVKLGLFLVNRKYRELALICEKRLRKNKVDEIALFYQLFGYINQKEYDKAKPYFFKMFETQELSTKTKERFIKSVIRSDLTNNKFKDVIQDCNKILVGEKSLELQKLLKKFLCNANYKLWNFDEVKKLCAELNRDFADDIEISKFTKGYYEAIEFEIDKKNNLHT
ncbi:MAG: hypothetical protein JEY91_13715 [Spirochaetaceae bacterium]|nr:hypothetical protein [Spirochaetaceae bacterium]